MRSAAEMVEDRLSHQSATTTYRGYGNDYVYDLYINSP